MQPKLVITNDLIVFIFSLLDEAFSNGSKVLVHCHAGISRSPTITIAYLMHHKMMTLLEAYKFVKNKRAIISPNFNFMGQLLDFEQNYLAAKISSKASFSEQSCSSIDGEPPSEQI